MSHTLSNRLSSSTTATTFAGYSTKDAAYKAGVATWLENVVAVNVKPTSLQKYQSHFKKHIVPHLDALKVQSLTPAMLEFAPSDGLYQQARLFFTTLKTELSERYILVDEFLLGKLRRWQSQQLDVEKISLVCALVPPHARDATNRSGTARSLQHVDNAKSLHAQHAEITG